MDGWMDGWMDVRTATVLCCLVRLFGPGWVGGFLFLVFLVFWDFDFSIFRELIRAFLNWVFGGSTHPLTHFIWMLAALLCSTLLCRFSSYLLYPSHLLYLIYLSHLSISLCLSFFLFLFLFLSALFSPRNSCVYTVYVLCTLFGVINTLTKKKRREKVVAGRSFWWSEFNLLPPPFFFSFLFFFFFSFFLFFHCACLSLRPEWNGMGWERCGWVGILFLWLVGWELN